MIAAPPSLHAAFEHERLESGFGQIEGGDQAVVPAADNDDIALPRHAQAAPFDVFEDFQRSQPAVVRP